MYIYDICRHYYNGNMHCTVSYEYTPHSLYQPLLSCPNSITCVYLYCCRFYEASKDLRTIVGAVENRADKDEIMSLVERARKAFQRELTGVFIVSPRRTCTARVTVLALCVCLLPL